METQNFASKKIGTTVVCDKASADGYDVSNLINECDLPFFSSNVMQGFVAANSVYPPINITFSFPYNILLEKIIINTKLNGLQTTSFEIYSCYYKNYKPNFNTINSSFRLIGRAEGEDTHIFSFYNSLYDNLKKPGDLPLTHNYPQFLNSTFALTIRLTHSLNRNSFCLSSVKIFGKLANKTILKSISDIKSNSLTTINIKNLPKDKTCDINLNKSKLNSEPCNDTSNIVPQEFYDIITQELMTRPILLPSGHSIDQTTLDKHILEESKWGRKPSDPFTNIPFGNLLNPIINMPLKIRIDDYVLKNKDKILDSQNTLSSKASSRKLSYTTIIRSSQLIPKDILEQKSLKRKIENSPTNSNKKLKKYNQLKWEENDELIYQHYIPNTFYSKETKRCSECKKLLNIDDIIYKACCDLICQNCILVWKSNKQMNCKVCLCLINNKNITRMQYEL